MSDITGQKFGKLTVLGRDYSYQSPKHTKWFCKCECGNIKSIFRNSLISGRTQSCGCQMYKGKNGINKTHGMSNTRIYHEWASMKKRCLPNTHDSKQYHDRGISVCDEWKKDFVSFYNWSMENGYNDSLTIDRIDNNKGYSPQNCRWVSIEKQQSNKTNTIYVIYNNQKYCLRSLCIEIGFPYKTAHRRYTKLKNKGLPITSEKLFAPIQKNKIAFKYRKQE
jgi:hypothetical protein